MGFGAFKPRSLSGWDLEGSKLKGIITSENLGSSQTQKTREGCGCFWGLCGSSGGKFRENSGKLLEKFSRIAKCYEFQDFGHRERQTCRKHCVHTGLDLDPTFRAGCSSKSTVPAFSSFSDKPGCFKPGCLQFLRGSALCALLRTCICAHLCSFACFCVRPRLEGLRLGTAENQGLR